MPSRLSDIHEFVSDFAACMMGSGVHTDRVERCAKRLCDSQGADLNIAIFLHSFILTLKDRGTEESLTRVVSVPQRPICFERTAELSSLSWSAVDEKLDLTELRRRFDLILAKERLGSWIVNALASLANSAFCFLFGGDPIAMGMVFLATFVGMGIKNLLLGKLNVYLVFLLSAFAASLLASASLLLPCTASIAVATSPLFLVPGVPLINGCIDMLEGNVLIGFCRIINAGILTLCIAVGLATTLTIVQGGLF